MTWGDIKKKAKALGIKVGNTMNKETLIRAIQRAEGHTPCFKTGVKNCPYTDCCFRSDCFHNI